MKTRLIGLYSLGLGLAVIGLWAVLLLSGAPQESAGALGFHLVSELIMALGCIAAGALVLRHHPAADPAIAAAHAMVVYSTLNAAGFYLSRGALAVSLAMVALALLSGLLALSRLRRG